MQIDSENFGLALVWNQPIAWKKILAGVKIVFLRILTWFKIGLLLLGGSDAFKRIEGAMQQPSSAAVAKTTR